MDRVPQKRYLCVYPCMYQPTVLNSLVLETLPMAALNNLPPQHISRLSQTFGIGWSSFLKQNGVSSRYVCVYVSMCAHVYMYVRP